jgi:hypothetical protein
VRECEHGRVRNAYGDGLGCPAECGYYEPRIDRGALLELAEEMDGVYPDSRDVAVEYIDDYARRIREACGVES